MAGVLTGGWTGACTGTNPQCIIDILPLDTKPGGYQVGAIFTQALITAQCAGVAPGEIQNGTQLLNASFTFSGTLSGPAPTAVIIASDIGIDCCGLPSIDYSVTPFTCGSWTPYEFPTYFIPGFGYFINSNYGPGYTGGTQCIQLNTPPVSLNWQQTYTIKDVYPEGQNFIFGATIYLFYVGGNEPALAARASASAGCRIPDQ